MDNKIKLMRETFQNEQTGEPVEGVTVLIDGMLAQFLEAIRQRSGRYPDNLHVIQEALMRGLESIKEELS